MPDWNTRLAVFYEAEGKSHAVIPVDAFSPTFTLNAEVLHSLEATHIGVVRSPQSITFSLTVKAIGPSAAELTSLALRGARFNVILQEAEGGHDWSFTKLVLSDCVLTSANPTNATISGAPAATFSGFSLQGAAEPKTGTRVEVP